MLPGSWNLVNLMFLVHQVTHLIQQKYFICKKKKEKKESWSTSFLLAVVASYCLDNVSYRYRQFLTVKSCFHSDLQIVEQTYCKLQSPIIKCEKGYIFVCI